MVGGKFETGRRGDMKYIIATALKKLAVHAASKIFINLGAPSQKAQGRAWSHTTWKKLWI